MVPGVRGAIQELEKRFHKAGVALMQAFFPALDKDEPERYRTDAEKEVLEQGFWRDLNAQGWECLFHRSFRGMNYVNALFDLII